MAERDELISDRIRALEARCEDGRSTVSWPAQIALGRAAGHLGPVVERLEQLGHGPLNHDHDCPSCETLREVAASFDDLERSDRYRPDTGT